MGRSKKDPFAWLADAPDSANYPDAWTWLVAAGEKARRQEEEERRTQGLPSFFQFCHDVRDILLRNLGCASKRVQHCKQRITLAACFHRVGVRFRGIPYANARLRVLSWIERWSWGKARR